MKCRSHERFLLAGARERNAKRPHQHVPGQHWNLAMPRSRSCSRRQEPAAVVFGLEESLDKGAAITALEVPRSPMRPQPSRFMRSTCRARCANSTTNLSKNLPSHADRFRPRPLPVPERPVTKSTPIHRSSSACSGFDPVLCQGSIHVLRQSAGEVHLGGRASPRKRLSPRTILLPTHRTEVLRGSTAPNTAAPR